MAAFTIQEYQDRIQKTQKSMAAEEIELLLVADPANINYLTGYDGYSFYVPQMVIVTLTDTMPLWIGRAMDRSTCKMTAWIDEDHMDTYTEDYVQSAVKHPMQFVADIIGTKGFGRSHIGVEMDACYFSAKSFQVLKSCLPNAVFSDCTLLVKWVRQIKSETEINYMRKAGQLVAKSMKAALDKAEPGVRECDVAAEIYHSQLSGTRNFGGDYPAIVPLIHSGKKTCSPHVTWSEEPFESGQIATFELGAAYRRYHCCMSRTAYMGNPPAQVAKASDTIIEGLELTIGAVRSGVSSHDVESVWRRHIEKHGFHKDARLAYPVGLGYPPDWGEHTLSIRCGEERVLKPNMTFHLIPGLWFDDYGVVISETIRVTTDGCEVLAKFPRDLFIKNRNY